MKENQNENSPEVINEGPISKSKSLEELFKSFLEKEYNRYFERMSSELIQFLVFKEKEENIKHVKSHEMEYKNQLYSLLERNLIEIIYLSDKEDRKEKIKILFNWYKDKMKLFEELYYINQKSYIDPDSKGDKEYFSEKMTKIDVLLRDDDIRKEQMKHRTQENYDRKLLNNYRRVRVLDNPYCKKLLKQSKALKLLREQQKEKGEEQDMELDQDHSMPMIGSFLHINQSVGDTSNYYTSVRTKKLFSLKGISDISNKPEGGEKERNFHTIINQGKADFYPDINKEIKSCFSYNRPFYDLQILSAEKKINEKKIESFAEKRNEEEIKKNIEQFGINRARYKETALKRIDLKNVINMYVKTNKLESSTLLKKYYEQSVKKLNIKKNILDINDSKRTTNRFYDEEDSSKVSSKKYTRKSFYQSEDLALKKSASSNIDVSSKKFMKKHTVEIGSKTMLKHFRTMGKKIIIEDIKNLNNETNEINEAPEENIITYDIKCKYKTQSNSIKKKLLKTKINSEHDNSITSSDVIFKLINNEPIFKQKMLSDNLCGIKAKMNDKRFSSEPVKEESIYHNFCLSAYTSKNIKAISKHSDNLKNDLKILKYISPLSKYIGSKKLLNENTSFNDFRDNFLNLRKNMGQFKKYECNELLTKIQKNTISNFKDSMTFRNIKSRKNRMLLSAIINPQEEYSYPLLYLPRSGRTLLARGNALSEPKKKKKRRK